MSGVGELHVAARVVRLLDLCKELGRVEHDALSLTEHVEEWDVLGRRKRNLWSVEGQDALVHVKVRVAHPTAERGAMEESTTAIEFVH